MDGETTTIGGIVIPSTDPVFLAVVIGVHIPLGIACVVTGASAMLSRKGRGRHSGRHDLLLVPTGPFCLNNPSLGHALVGELPPVRLGRCRLRVRVVRSFGTSTALAGMGETAHSGMSLSYVVMLIAFYVDNGKQLPIWKDLPHFTYWLVPPVVAAPLIVWALLRHPMVLRMKRAEHP